MVSDASEAAMRAAEEIGKEILWFSGKQVPKSMVCLVARIIDRHWAYLPVLPEKENAREETPRLTLDNS